MTKLGRMGLGGRALWRRLLLVFALAAFAQASYITQTHIHPAAATETRSGQNSHAKAPLRDDPAHCPFCQEYLLSGAYFVPPPIIVPLPVSVAVTLASVVHVSHFVAAFSYNWHGRAPPLI